jgi:aspartate/methionine/tyrosine aminotransferase
LSLGYTESQGHPLLRDQVAGHYDRATAQDVLVVAPEEGIFIAMQALLEPGDHVIVTFPGYQSLYEVAAALGCRVTRWSLQATAREWQLDLSVLERSIKPQTRLLVINFPHNPTGFLPDREMLEELVELARGHGLYLFSDEMYRGLEYDPRGRLPAICDLYQNGVSLSGLSKVYALPGLRIGWLVSRDQRLLNRMQLFKDYTTICSSAPSEVLSIIALRAGEIIIERNLALIRQNLEHLDQFMAQHKQWFEWLRPQAGSVAFPRLKKGGSADRFCQALLEQKGVLLVPASTFEYPGEHFRLGLGRRNLADGLGHLEVFLNEQRFQPTGDRTAKN